MNYIINKCEDCPFFKLNEDLDHGLYSTGVFDSYCNAPEMKLANISDEIAETTVLDNCPLKEGITLKTN